MTATDLTAVVDALRSNERFLVLTHENPDGDALGSMLGAALGLRELGKDVVMHLSGDAPLPGEYGFLPFGELRRDLPDDLEERVVLALDCANERRIGPDADVLERAPLVINVDHHHDNNRFGKLNLIVAEASSTAEIVRDLLGELDVALTPEIAEALYVGLVTDTGRFQYTNTTPKALRLAAELVEAGADVHGIFQRVYETAQFAKLKLLARALDRAQLYEGGRLLVSYLVRSDFSEVGAVEPYSEGIIDYLRQAEGASTRVPVIFLTARDQEDDRVTGFIRGGDDYVTKPFSLEELTLRIGALLRRTKSPGAGNETQRLKYRDLELDEDRHQVWRAGDEVRLSPTEFRLLRYLLLNSERVLSKQQILDHVWQYDFNGDDNVVETYISYLRRKLDLHHDPLIRTVRGFGYTLRAEAA